MSRKDFAIMLSGLILEIAAVYLLLEVSILLGLLLHCCTIGGLWYISASDSRIMQIYIFSTAFLGPIGAFGSLGLAIYHYLSSARGKSFIEWFNSIFPKRRAGFAESIVEALEHGRDLSAVSYSVMPLKDIIALGSESQKQRALSGISDNFHPSLLPALQLALQDKSGVIRVMAATIITKVDSRIHSMIMDLERQISFDNSPEVLKLLAEYYDLYAYSGLNEGRKERIHRARALEYYQEYLKRNPEDMEARQNVARGYMRQGRDEEALQWLEKCIAENISSPAMLMWQAESLFRLKKFNELRIFTAKHKEELARHDIYPIPFADAVNLWSRHAS